jgi:AcrR family transcriptional regulator
MTPRKANQVQLDREQIVSAAMNLIDRHGLDGYSMRQLGAELGVDPSTVYYYVPSKAALYNLIVDEIVSGIDLAVDDPSATFEERVVAAGREYRRALLRHPRAVPLVAVRSLRTPVQLRVIERLAQIFFDAGFSPVEVMVAVDVCGMTILGTTNMHAASVAHSDYREQEPEIADFSADALASGDYPNLTRMLAESAGLNADLEFDRAMRAMAKGLHALHEAGELAPSAADRGSATR